MYFRPSCDPPAVLGLKDHFKTWDSRLIFIQGQQQVLLINSALIVLHQLSQWKCSTKNKKWTTTTVKCYIVWNLRHSSGLGGRKDALQFIYVLLYTRTVNVQHNDFRGCHQYHLEVNVFTPTSLVKQVKSKATTEVFNPCPWGPDPACFTRFPASTHQI